MIQSCFQYPTTLTFLMFQDRSTWSILFMFLNEPRSGPLSFQRAAGSLSVQWHKTKKVLSLETSQVCAFSEHCQEAGDALLTTDANKKLDQQRMHGTSHP